MLGTDRQTDRIKHTYSHSHALTHSHAHPPTTHPHPHIHTHSHTHQHTHTHTYTHACSNHTNSKFRTVWDLATIVVLGYVAVFTPFQLSFLNEHSWDSFDQNRYKGDGGTGFFFLDRLIDAMFCVDIIINFRSAYVNERGHVLFHQSHVAAAYMQGWFTFDVLSVLPWDLLAP